MTTISLVAGGPKENLADLTKYHSDEMIWVGIDRGSRYLLDLNIPLHYAFGDFDSISYKEHESLKTKIPNLNTLPSEKDKTDTEIALDWAISQKPDQIYIFGATGGRLDHLLGNIHLLIKSTSTLSKIDIIDQQNQITLYTSGTYKVKRKIEWDYISFIAITSDIHGLTLDGFKYPLKNCHIRLGSTLCISNELIGDVGTFSFQEGILLMIRSRD
ncbi:thiamine diphosphokinase [Metabacillus halosaccharovorans]|uniref:thiamine diphosphokinase n=1 Tax=Metabacillus halosaccharovorans TaxID=930124 RepID=UPI0034CED694